MPVYEYIGINKTGKSTKGTLDAESVRAARQKLRSQGIFPTEVKEGHEVAKNRSRDVKQYFVSNRVSLDDLAIATRQLSTLISAGLPIVDALAALADQVESPPLKRTLIDIRESVQEGTALAKAMTNFPKTFPRLYVNMVRSGEASGTLDAVLENLADYLEAQQDLRRKISSALFYPILMLVFCVLVVAGLLAFVVPSIVEIFIKEGAALPLPTQITLALSNFLTSYWFLLIALMVLLVFTAKLYYNDPNGRKKIDGIVLKLPIAGQLLLKINTARVSRTLGTLLLNGVGLLEALEIVKNIVANVHLAQAIDDARDGVREGRGLAKELGRSKLYPPMVIRMIAVGETSGRLEPMLNKAGQAYESEVNATLAGLTSLISPILLIVIGGVVFFIVISILLPMVDLINIVKH
ncbi:MAG: type II secretion system inner membrane protein GspF [Bdellovibrionales bacterium]|nr:type II secretion system inner membrane protein GspF [Bdellovibrionales bacterium]